MLLETSHEDRSESAAINFECAMHRDICVTLDTICSKLRIKTGQPQQQDFKILEHAISNLNYLWAKARLSFTPKVHSTIEHSLDHMKRFNGIGNMLEDDVEHIHQIAAKIEAQVSRMKNKNHQALVHSKLEHMQNTREIREVTEQSILLSKQNFKKRNLELCATTKLAKAKIDRDYNRIEALHRITNSRDGSALLEAGE